jgi:predicted enzyme related to lactoylglutathione lyase
MPEKTVYAPGTPCWVDVAWDDVEACATFYGGLFGWQPTVVPDGGGYTMFHQDGKAVAAAGPRQEGSLPRWSTYIAIESADETAARIAAAGGSLLLEPFDVYDAGRMAFAVDTLGSVFGLWQAREHLGAQLVNEPFAYAWAELLTTDIVSSQSFYTAVFGWLPQEVGDDPSFLYRMQVVGDRPVGGIYQVDEMSPGWAAYFAVEDAEATVARAEELGGVTLRPPADTRYGRMAVLEDPAGAGFAVIRLAAGLASA